MLKNLIYCKIIIKKITKDKGKKNGFKGKEKDKTINELQGRVQQQDELIRYDAKLIDQLYGKAQKLQECLKKSRQIVDNLVKSIRGIDNSIETSQKYAEQHESKGLFKRIGDRFKSIFSKQVPQLNSGNFLQSARENCRIAEQTAISDIQGTRDDGLGQIQQGIQERNNLQRLVYSRGFSRTPEVSRTATAPTRPAVAPSRAPAPAPVKETRKTGMSSRFQPAGDDFEK